MSDGSAEKTKSNRLDRQVKQVWESIKCPGDQSSKDSDEIYFLKLLARNQVQIESFYGCAKRTNTMCLVLAGAFGIAGVVFAPAIVWLIDTKTANQSMMNQNYIYVAVLGMILLEILAGLCIWASYSMHRRMEHYHGILCDREQILLSVGIAVKAERGDPNLKGELYKRILESELRRREEIAALNKKK